MKFIFDLDGTITAEETLPLIAKLFCVEQQISELTKETIQGNVPFIESFIKRVHILGAYPVNEASELLSKVKLHSLILEFINQHKDDCIIATGNLDCWIDSLAKRIGCKYYCSSAIVENNKIVKLKSILNKETVVKKYKDLGEEIVYIGDGNNDMEGMRLADISIAAGLIHLPARSILPFANYLIFNEITLCRQLNQLL